MVGRAPIVVHKPRLITDFEKELKLKHGTSRRFLPMLALRHRYVVDIGVKTFRLVDLSRNNDPKSVFLKHLKECETKGPPDGREIIIACDKIDRELHWPKGATKIGLLHCGPPWNPELAFEDVGGNKVRIVLKPHVKL
jgi:hypothetical protein